MTMARGRLQGWVAVPQLVISNRHKKLKLDCCLPAIPTICAVPVGVDGDSISIGNDALYNISITKMNSNV